MKCDLHTRSHLLTTNSLDDKAELYPRWVILISGLLRPDAYRQNQYLKSNFAVILQIEDSTINQIENFHPQVPNLHTKKTHFEIHFI